MEAETAKFRMRPGMGAHRYKGKTYHPGDVIECPPYTLRHCIDKFEQLDGGPVTEVEVEPRTEPAKALEIVYKKGGYYDVLNPATGKPINANGLRKAEAMALAGMEPEPEEDAEDADPEPDGDAE